MNSDPKAAAEARLEDQVLWYDKKSGFNQKCFKWLKVVQIGAGLLIPLVASLVSDKTCALYVASGLGVTVSLLEGIQQLWQFQANWYNYRSTTELLKHEKHLYLAKAGPYATATNPVQVLAERVESLVSQEHAKWAASQAQPKATPPTSAESR